MPESIRESSIEFAKDKLPDVFDPVRIAPLSLSGNGHYDDQYFSPMLYEVLLLLGHNLTDDESANLLTRAKRAFGEEWFQPTMATIMAMILLSLYLSEQLEKAGDQLNSPLFAPPIVQGLLGKSC